LAWLASVAPGSGRVGPKAADIEITMELELARTALALAELATVGPGDAVVFDGAPAPARDEDWPVRARVGNLAAAATVDSDGNLRLAAPFRELEHGRRIMESEAEPTQISPADGPSDAERVLAAAPVEVVAELGRIAVRGDELAGLVRGSVLPFGPPRLDTIELRVGGRLWAVGELVTVGDELGVRITRMAGG
jgi:type III secretion protein Q